MKKQRRPKARVPPMLRGNKVITPKNIYSRKPKHKSKETNYGKD